MSVTFDSSPILSHRIRSGTQASDGTARTAPSVGAEQPCPSSAESPVTAPSSEAERGTDGEADEHALRRDGDERARAARAGRARSAAIEDRPGRRQLDGAEDPEARGHGLPQREQERDGKDQRRPASRRPRAARRRGARSEAWATRSRVVAGTEAWFRPPTTARVSSHSKRPGSARVDEGVVEQRRRAPRRSRPGS